MKWNNVVIFVLYSNTFLRYHGYYVDKDQGST